MRHLILFIAFVGISVCSFGQTLSTGNFSGVNYTKVPPGYLIEMGLNKKIYCPSRNYYVVYQTDGNFVLYKAATQEALWASNTMIGGAQPNRFLMQDDGNLVMYWNDSRKRNYVKWATNTSGNNGAFLAIQNDGNVVIYTSSNHRALWATGTNGR